MPALRTTHYTTSPPPFAAFCGGLFTCYSSSTQIEMGGDEECCDEISHVLSQAAKFPPGCLERRGFALLYWQHAGTGSHSTEQEKGAYRSQIHEDGPMKHLQCPRGLHQYLCGHPNGLFIVGLGTIP